MNESTTAMLLASLLDGENVAWDRLSARAPELEGVPAQLCELAAIDEAKATPSHVAELSSQLRLAAAQASTASASLMIGSLTVMRLSTLGHEDPNWASLLPRWLVPSLPDELRGVGLLAVGLTMRDHVPADEYADLMDQALQLLPQAIPLRNASIYQYALFLGLRGMLQRLADTVDLPHIGDQEPEVAVCLLAESYYDAVCAGRTGQASFLERRLLATPETAWQMGLLHLHRGFVPVFDAILTEKPIPDTADVPSLPLLRALLAGDHEYLGAYEPILHQDEISPLLSFDGLRCALACRDHASARTIIDRRAHGPMRHWLDDFFLARLLLLEDKETEAGSAFARSIAAAQRYGSMERLEIELRLAPELSRNDCCRLGNLAVPKRAPSGSFCVPSSKVASDSTLAEAQAILVGESAGASRLRHDFAQLCSSPGSRIMLSGPDDGCRRAIARLVQNAVAPNVKMFSFSAAQLANPSVSAQFGLALDEHGVVFLDDVHQLDALGQSILLASLPYSSKALLICGAIDSLCTQVATAAWRPELFWRLATRRIQIPGMEQRSGDFAEILAALMTAQGLVPRFDIHARSATAHLNLTGGWAQLVAFATHLGRSSDHGYIARSSMETCYDELMRGFPVAG